jgi:hypothetical protein
MLVLGTKGYVSDGGISGPHKVAHILDPTASSIMLHVSMPVAREFHTTRYAMHTWYQCIKDTTTSSPA